MDAPEVDPYVLVSGADAEVGSLIRVRVESVQEDFALCARVIES